ncbi:hypothetical protein FACS1894177_03210 [Bacteroidia bacterium]|nr:hypothetical protein FACS1894177_03210 [Bacteroidia bacterium]
MVKEYAERFNQNDDELYAQFIPNSEAADFLTKNIPRFECPDKELEEIYYFRWWTYRKHIQKTPEGYVITEFLPKVGWAGKYNAINCAAALHYGEGRWLHNSAKHGLFWQIDGYEGTELSIGGHGLRPVINSFMIADAEAIAKISTLLGNWEQQTWPMSTTMTLLGLANLLQTEQQKFITKKDYLDLLKIYAHSHHLKKDDGTVGTCFDITMLQEGGLGLFCKRSCA